MLGTKSRPFLTDDNKSAIAYKEYSHRRNHLLELIPEWLEHSQGLL